MKTHCDFECAAANDCLVGGIRCGRCGDRFCATEIGEGGLCADCAERHRREMEEEAEDGE